MSGDLFETAGVVEPAEQRLSAGATLLRGFAIADEVALLACVQEIAEHAPFRHMVTPGGFRMAVAMTNCGPFGRVTDKTGYGFLVFPSP